MKQKCITVCIIGKPNAGKSTLLNSLVGQKIAIVAPKVQNKRSSITGILTEEHTQLIFIDTPGIFNPKKKLEKAMVRCAWSSIIGVDKVILLNPLQTLNRGYAIIKENNQVLTSIKGIKLDSELMIHLKDGLINTKVIKIIKEEQNG